MPADVDAFDPAALIIIATGPLTGTLAPTTGRTVMASLSPRIYPKPWYTHSTLGGWFGPELKYAGYDAVVIRGAASAPVRLEITDGKARLVDAGRPVGQRCAGDAARAEAASGRRDPGAGHRPGGREPRALCHGAALRGERRRPQRLRRGVGQQEPEGGHRARHGRRQGGRPGRPAARSAAASASSSRRRTTWRPCRPARPTSASRSAARPAPSTAGSATTATWKTAARCPASASAALAWVADDVMGDTQLRAAAGCGCRRRSNFGLKQEAGCTSCATTWGWTSGSAW